MSKILSNFTLDNMGPIFEIKTEQKTENYGRFVVEPLDEGYGQTLGTALRRVLLTSIPGAAITQVKITGVRHQFSTIPGMKEDVVEFLLNLKKVRLFFDSDKPVKLQLAAHGKKEVKAGDLKGKDNVRITNPDFVLATLSAPKAELQAEMQAEKGVGYSPATERKTGIVGLIPLDAVFSPVLRVNYRVEQTRVGRLTNYDRLTLELWTDGTIKPEDVLHRAAEILVGYFVQIVTPRKPKKAAAEVALVPPTVAKLSVEELTLPTRIANALVQGGYETVEDIVSAKPGHLLKVRNLGQKSLKVIAAALSEKGVKFEIP